MAVYHVFFHWEGTLKSTLSCFINHRSIFYSSATTSLAIIIVMLVTLLSAAAVAALVTVRRLNRYSSSTTCCRENWHVFRTFSKFEEVHIPNEAQLGMWYSMCEHTGGDLSGGVTVVTLCRVGLWSDLWMDNPGVWKRLCCRTEVSLGKMLSEPGLLRRSPWPLTSLSERKIPHTAPV